MFNRLVAGFTALGVSVYGSRVLEVKGRKSANGGRHRSISCASRVPVLRAYVKKWKLEVGVFFSGAGPDASDEELRRIAPDHPVFRLTVT